MRFVMKMIFLGFYSFLHHWELSVLSNGASSERGKLSKIVFHIYKFNAVAL